MIYRKNTKKGFTPLEINKQKACNRRSLWKLQSLTGFTAVETIAVAVILLFVLTAAFSSYILISQYSSNTTIQSQLQRQSRAAVTSIGRDIRLASAVAVTAGGDSMTLTYPGWLGWNDRRYRIVGSQVMYTPDLGAVNETAIVDKVNILAGERLFTYDNVRNMVTIDLRAQNAALRSGAMQTARITTIVHLRN